MTVSLNKPSRNSQDWHNPLNENFTKIEDELSVGERIYSLFFCHEQDTPNMSVQVDAGFIWTGRELKEVSAQSTNNLAAPSGDDRIDRVVIDGNDGTVSVIEGTVAASPSAPTIPGGKLPVAQLYLTPSTTEITDSDITDERVFPSSGGLSDPVDATDAGTDQFQADFGSLQGGETLLVDFTSKSTTGSPELENTGGEPVSSNPLVDADGNALWEGALYRVHFVVADLSNNRWIVMHPRPRMALNKKLSFTKNNGAERDATWDFDTGSQVLSITTST